MIQGIGCDVIAVERFRDKINDEKFLQKVFTASERAYLSGRTAETMAGMWASKEAVSKALGCGFVGLSYHDIEILHTEAGQPYVNSSAKLPAKIHISISHEHHLAMAFAVVE